MCRRHAKKEKGSLIQIQNQSQRSERERRNCVPRGVEFHERALCSTITITSRRIIRIPGEKRENKKVSFDHHHRGEIRLECSIKKNASRLLKEYYASNRFSELTFPLSKTCASKSPSVRSTAPAFAPVMASKPTSVRDFFMPNMSDLC